MRWVVPVYLFAMMFLGLVEFAMSLGNTNVIIAWLWLVLGLKACAMLESRNWKERKRATT